MVIKDYLIGDSISGVVGDCFPLMIKNGIELELLQPYHLMKLPSYPPPL